MKSEIATALDTALTQKGETGPLSVAELPESLVETVYIESELRAPTRCQKPDVNCTEYVDVERSSAGTVITCERGHEVTIDTRQYLYGNPVYEKIFAGSLMHSMKTKHRTGN